MKSGSTKLGFKLASGKWPMRFLSMMAILAIVITASACGQTGTSKNSTQASGSTSKATATSKTNPTTQATAKKVTNPQIDDTVYFGHYYTARGLEPIAWKIIDLEEGRAMIITDQVIDAKPFNNQREFVDWETCSLRRWLNDEFLKSAFTNSEQKEIQIGEYDYQLKDSVFILSLEQIDFLEVSRDTLQTDASELAVAKDVAVIKDLGLWWLRDLDGQKNRTYSARFYQEKARSETYTVSNVGVRPVLWVNISALFAEPAVKPTPAKASSKVTSKPVEPNTTAADYEYFFPIAMSQSRIIKDQKRTSSSRARSKANPSSASAGNPLSRMRK